jgi:coiled-coil domain-containing protein 130
MQGFNMGRYYPPDASNPPSFNNNLHSLGKRSQGTVRFELPFAVWCDHCTPPAIVGQGVRFNAEKKKIGNYYSTPIWSFRMKHTACGGWWEIQTDPKNSEYKVVEGARLRDYGPSDKGTEAEGELKFLTEEERQRRREDAFASLEGKIEEKGAEKEHKKRIEELYDKSEVWRDPYDVNARLRRDFRAKRKVWKKEEMHKEGMQDKFSLGLDIVDETEADRTRAGLVEFGANASGDRDLEDQSWKPLFTEENTLKSVKPGAKTKKLKAEIAAEQSRQCLQQKLIGNTRATIDPFLSKESGPASRINLGILKRKRDTSVEPPATTVLPEKTDDAAPIKKPALLSALVGYDSD